MKVVTGVESGCDEARLKVSAAGTVLGGSGFVGNHKGGASGEWTGPADTWGQWKRCS